MKPLIVLIIAFALSLFGVRLFSSQYNFPLAARIAMAVMLVFTAIAHFAFTRGMEMMLPDFIPFRIVLVYLTGIMEILFAIGLLIPSLQFLTGWALIVFFLLLLPANVYAAYHHIDYQKGTHDGAGLNYLWFRVPLQILFIVWVYMSAMR